MSEVQVSYETRAWRYACDVCKEGDMISIGNQLLPTSPPMYPSQCTNCGFVCNLLHKYPKVETVIGDIDYSKLANVEDIETEVAAIHDAATKRQGRRKAKDPMTGEDLELPE